MENGDGVPSDGESEAEEPPIGASESGSAAVDHRVGGKRAARVKRVTLDEMVGLLNRELRDSARVDDGRTPMRLVMHSGPAEAPKRANDPSASGETGNTNMPHTPESDSHGPQADNVDDLPRPPKVPTIPGTRLFAPTVPSDPPKGRPGLAVLKSAWPWIALGLLVGLLFGWPLYRHLMQ